LIRVLNPLPYFYCFFSENTEEEREASRFPAPQHPDGAEDGIGQAEDGLA
jgi:hypothetical protein